MRALTRRPLLALGAAGLACSRPPQPPAAQTRVVQATAGLDSLNARIVDAYRRHDPRAYAALYTDTAVFEWPAVPTVRGPAALAAMARQNSASLRDLDRRLDVATRRRAPEHATEVGAFQQSYRDTGGTRRTEFGRYVAVSARQADGHWRLDRFFGFADSTRPPTRAP